MSVELQFLNRVFKDEFHKPYSPFRDDIGIYRLIINWHHFCVFYNTLHETVILAALCQSPGCDIVFMYWTASCPDLGSVCMFLLFAASVQSNLVPLILWLW